MHLPSGQFTANSVWTVLAAIAFNLPPQAGGAPTRTAGVLASRFYAKARTAMILAQLLADCGAGPDHQPVTRRSWRLHLPRNWPWQTGWETLFDATGTLPMTT